MPSYSYSTSATGKNNGSVFDSRYTSRNPAQSCSCKNGKDGSSVYGKGWQAGGERGASLFSYPLSSSVLPFQTPFSCSGKNIWAGGHRRKEGLPLPLLLEIVNDNLLNIKIGSDCQIVQCLLHYF